jgi:YegS/Rv2252/BmrU family lipid kinase
MAAQIRLLVNPSAGGGKAGRVAPAVERELRAHGLIVSRDDTRGLDHARELAVEAANRGETVVGLSGDGLIRVLADVLREIPESILGVLPGGRGNDLARVLGIPDDPIAACATIAHGVPRPIDLGLVRNIGAGASECAFVGIASVGFDSDANRIANEAPAWLGGLVYAYGALRALLSWRPAHFELELLHEPESDGDGERIVERLRFTAYSIGAANSKSYGGGMRAAPGALLDDGLLDVLVLERVSKLRFLTRILPKVFSGTHVRESCVHVFRASEIAISADRPFTMYADGDPIGQLPLRVRALRGAVTILAPDLHTSDSPFGEPPPSPSVIARRSDQPQTGS